MSRAAQVTARLAELSGASAAELASALREYDVRDIAAAIAAGGVGGGEAFNGGTITEDLEVAPADSTLDTLFQVTAPTGFEDDSGDGCLIRAVAEDATDAVFIDTYGTFEFTAPTGQGSATMRLKSIDNSTKVVHVSTFGGVTVTSNNGELQIVNEGDERKFVASEALGVLTATHAAPADGALNAGECALWFDQTNGAAKLMIKAKTADGTVVTGNVPLT